jgi:hypothetical protein
VSGFDGLRLELAQISPEFLEHGSVQVRVVVRLNSRVIIHQLFLLELVGKVKLDVVLGQFLLSYFAHGCSVVVDHCFNLHFDFVVNVGEVAREGHPLLLHLFHEKRILICTRDRQVVFSPLSCLIFELLQLVLYSCLMDFSLDLLSLVFVHLRKHFLSNS